MDSNTLNLILSSVVGVIIAVATALITTRSQVNIKKLDILTEYIKKPGVSSEEVKKLVDEFGGKTVPSPRSRTIKWLIPLGAGVLVALVSFLLLAARGGERSNFAASNLIKGFDFETSADGWTELVKWDTQWQNPQTSKNAGILSPRPVGHGVAYVLTLTAGGWANYSIQYQETVQADVIVANVYLPDTPNLEDNWVGVAATRIPNVDGQGPWLASSGGTIPLGKWTQIVLDLRSQYDPNDIPLNSRPVFVQIAYLVKGRSILASDTVLAGLDNVSWYQAVGAESIREQQGTGRKLFDFEDENMNGWQISNNRVPTDTLMLSSEKAYRGRLSLRLNTQLTSQSGNSFLSYSLAGQPKGVWIARVYLPDNVPEGTVWADFYTYSSSGWQDSKVRSLVSGQWNTLVWDIHDAGWDWNGLEKITLGIQFGVGIEGGSYQGPIYIDDIQLFDK